MDDAHFSAEFQGQLVDQINGQLVVRLLGVRAVKGKPVAHHIETFPVIRFNKAAVIKSIQLVGLGIVAQEFAIRGNGVGQPDHLFHIIIAKGWIAGVDEEGPYAADA